MTTTEQFWRFISFKNVLWGRVRHGIIDAIAEFSYLSQALVLCCIVGQSLIPIGQYTKLRW